MNSFTRSPWLQHESPKAAQSMEPLSRGEVRKFLVRCENQRHDDYVRKQLGYRVLPDLTTGEKHV